MEDKAPRLGAALAFYTLLSLAPLLVIAVAVAAFFFGRQAVEGQLFWQTRELLGGEGARVVQDLVRASFHPKSGIFSMLAAIAVLFAAASSLVLELTDALNTIWHVSAPESSGPSAMLSSIFRDRLRSFGIVVGTGVLLLVSLLINAAISALGSFFNEALPMPEFSLRAFEFIVSFSATTLLFGIIYKVIPSVRLRWGDVLIGSCVTALLFTGGKQLIGIYLGKAGFASTYGAAGSLIAVLVWVYYSSQLFFLGAEFTKVYARTLGSHSPTKAPNRM
jgi:membrane protein